MIKRVAFAAAGIAVVLSTVAVGAQRASNDRISGTWASDSRPLLELAAPSNELSGTVHFYEGTTRRASVPIDSGSFDDRTGAVRLEGRVTNPDGRQLTYVIDGVLEGEVLRVTLLVDGTNRGSQVLRRVDQSQGK